MAGTVRTKEKCPKCQGVFKGNPLHCPTCCTTPRRYFVSIGWPGHGKIRLYSGQDGHPLDSHERAHRLLTHIRYEIDRGTFDPRNYVKVELRALRFENYAEAWLARQEARVAQGQLSRSFLEVTRSYIKNYLSPAFQGRSIREISEGTLEDFVLRCTGLKPKTVYNILGVLKKLLRDAYRRRDIARLLDFPKVEVGEAETRWITEEDQRLILEQIPDPVMQAFFLFLMKQAWRPGEARALKWERVDLVNGIVICAAAMDKNVYREYTKGRDVRVQPLHPEVQEALDALPRSLSGFVFTFRGRPLGKQLVYEVWRRAAKQAGVNISCYQGTRHSLASQAINAGVDKALIGKFLGHKDPRSTDRYAKLRTETLKGMWQRPSQAKVLKFRGPERQGPKGAPKK